MFTQHHNPSPVRVPDQLGIPPRVCLFVCVYLPVYASLCACLCACVCLFVNVCVIPHQSASPTN